MRFALIVLASVAMHEVTATEAKVLSPVTVPSGALLESADGQIIGSLTGRVLAQDDSGALLGAYAVLSARGYFAEVLPSGALGQVDALVYGEPRSLSDLGNRREVVGERGQIGAHSRRIVGLFNENARLYGPLSQRRSRFTLSPTGS